MFGRRRDDASRDRQRSRGASSVERDYTITGNFGGFGNVSLRWSGTSPEDVRDSFLEYLENDAEFNDTPDGRHRNRRSLYVRFNGRRHLLTFRTDWISGFTVH